MGELKSTKDFSKKAQKFKKDWMWISKTKLIGVRDSSKQKNNRPYLTYYENEYNLDKSNIGNINIFNTRTRTRTTTEGNLRQENSTNVVTF